MYFRGVGGGEEENGGRGNIDMRPGKARMRPCRTGAFEIVHNIHYYGDMNRPLTLNVRVSGRLSDHVSANVGERGAYENVSEYVRDLIRRDMERMEAERFASLRSELQTAFAQPDSDFHALTAEDVIARNRRG